MINNRRTLALVTGVFSDIGLEFARVCAHPVRCDLSTLEGVRCDDLPDLSSPVRCANGRAGEYW